MIRTFTYKDLLKIKHTLPPIETMLNEDLAMPLLKTPQVQKHIQTVQSSKSGTA